MQGDEDDYYYDYYDHDYYNYVIISKPLSISPCSSEFRYPMRVTLLRKVKRFLNWLTCKSFQLTSSCCCSVFNFSTSCNKVRVGRNEIGCHCLPHYFSITSNELEVSPNNFGSLSITSRDWRDIYVIHRPGGPYWEKLCPRSRVRPEAGE